MTPLIVRSDKFKIIDGGWSANYVDGNGRPIPDPLQWPSSSNGAGFKPLADWTHSLGLKFGIWTLRGVNPIAAERKLPVLGADPPVTIDRIIYDDSRCFADPATARWCNCTWDSQGVGIDAAHPAAQLIAQLGASASGGVGVLETCV